MTTEELLAMATEFYIGPQPIVNGRAFWWEKYPKDAKRHPIVVTNTGHPDGGPDRWAISDDSNFCLNKNGEWEYQSLPSSRKNDFYNRCRYASREEAIEYAIRWREAILKWASENIEILKKKYAKHADDDRPFLNLEDVPTELLKF